MNPRWSNIAAQCLRRPSRSNEGMSHLESSPHRQLSQATLASNRNHLHFSGRHRHLFELAMRQEGLVLEEEIVGNYVFIKVHTPFDRLCQEAENIRLDMPLDGVSSISCTRVRK